MSQLSLVKNLAHIQEEQKYSQTYVELGPFRLLRGSMTEIAGETSSGKTSLAYMLLAHLTQNGEICAVVDLDNSFNPQSAADSSVILENILWIRCGSDLERAFKTIDYLIQANNFGLIWIDLSDHSAKNINYIPSSYWYRFRTRIKDSQTILLAGSKRSLMGSASNQSYECRKQKITWAGHGKFKLIDEVRVDLDTRKPFFIKPESATITPRY